MLHDLMVHRRRRLWPPPKQGSECRLDFDSGDLLQASAVKDPETRCVLIDEDVDAFRLPTRQELKQYTVIVTTCVAAGFLFRYNQQFSAPVDISHVLIDEAGQAPLLEALLPMLLARERTGAICLAGDPRQVRMLHGVK